MRKLRPKEELNNLYNVTQQMIKWWGEVWTQGISGYLFLTFLLSSLMQNTTTPPTYHSLHKIWPFTIQYHSLFMGREGFPLLKLPLNPPMRWTLRHGLNSHFLGELSLTRPNNHQGPTITLFTSVLLYLQCYSSIVLCLLYSLSCGTLNGRYQWSIFLAFWA